MNHQMNSRLGSILKKKKKNQVPSNTMKFKTHPDIFSDAFRIMTHILSDLEQAPIGPQ